MPNYDFRCLSCKRRFTVFMSYEEYGKQMVRCPHCSSDQVQRRIGRVRFARSEDSRMEDMSDLSGLEGLEDDPRALGKMMRKMSQETGEDMGPEFDEVINRLESGQSPEEIEQSIPGLGEEGGIAGDEGGEF